jgi:pyridoxine kinase
MAIRATFGHNLPEREGVFLERVLPSLNAPVSMSSFELI